MFWSSPEEATRLRVAVLVTLVACCWSASANADAVSPPPEDCAQGSQGVECHGPQRCAPIECTETASCGEGQTCQVARLCVDSINCCGGWGDPCPVSTVTASCEGGAACDQGTCQSVQVCLPGGSSGEDASTTPAGSVGNRPARWGCGCRAGERVPSAHAVVAGLLLAALALALRRRGERR